jgi:predicted O-methyltransferase YrrM
MSDVWTAVDDYIGQSVVRTDRALDAALENTDAAGMPAISVSPAQGKFLNLMVRITGARRVLEIGTLGGYSTIWMARALPEGGRLISLELEQRHAEVARANVAAAGLAEKVEVRVGPALRSLPKLADEARGHFDFAFIDADKANIPEYFDWAVRLSRPGAVIVVDNVVRRGALADPYDHDPNVVGVRRLHDMLLAMSDRVSATTIQTVGAKGYDGFTLAVLEA